MANFLANLPLRRPVPYRFTEQVLLPMIICSMLLSCSYLKSCECSCPDPCYYNSTGQRTHCSYSSFEEMEVYLYSTELLYHNLTLDKPLTYCGDDLSSYLNYSYPGFNFSSTGFLIPTVLMDQTPLWWVNSRDSSGPNRLVEASFDFDFSMSINGSAVQSNVDMLLAILSPLYTSDPCNNGTSFFSLLNGTIPDIAARESTLPSGSEVSVQVSEAPLDIMVPLRQAQGIASYANSFAINISIVPPKTNKYYYYNVSVTYNSGEHQLKVYVADAGSSAEENYRYTLPDSPIATYGYNLSSITSPKPTFGFISTVEHLIQNLETLDTSIQYIPTSTCSNNKRRTEVTIVVLVVIGSSVVVVASIAAAYCYFNSKYRRWKKDLDRLAESIQRLPGVPTQVEFATIKKATNNFSKSMELGKGAFGAVYRCRLPAPVTGEVLREVAVKKFTRNDGDRYVDFLAEVSVINRLRHKNIVPLVGWAYHKGEALLIYEYMSNGGLDQHLFRNSRTTVQQKNMATLQWKTRYDIVRDIATGLHYIHHEHEPMVLHRDIKASNVMLDSNLHARLGDFGIACIAADVTKSSVTVNGILGTWGYISPEYAKSCKATRQSDIYAFGVLVLEIVTGRQWNDVKPDDDDHITDWVLRFYREGKLLQIVDDSMVTAGKDANSQAVIADEAERMLLMGLACTHTNPSSRPSMVDVVQVITKSVPPPDVSPHRSAAPWLLTQPLRSRNSFYNTPASHLDDAAGSSATVELVVVQDSEEQPSSAQTPKDISLSMIA